jgi:FAD dependent oxidoreductase
MNIINETNEVPIVDEYDVVVVGGGMAAMGAALGACRNGLKVLVIEKSAMLGGLATLGFIAYYLPLCDGKGRKVTGGIAEELLHVSVKYGYSTLAPEWIDGKGAGTKKRYTTIYSPPEFIYALDELMIAEGIDLMFDTVFCKPVIEGDICRAVIVENKSGRSAYAARIFVDATGDADLVFRAGAQCVEEKTYLAYWFYNSSLEKMKNAVESGDIKKGISLEWRGRFLKDGTYSLGDKDYSGCDASDVTRFILDGRKILKKEIEKNRVENGSLIALPGMAQFRRTRRLEGQYLLKESDAMKSFDDSIGCIGHWLKPGIVYEIPYRTLVNKNFANIFATGRAISSSGDAWEATRVIPPAVLTGQAAGTAAAIAIAQKCAVADVPIADLQKKMEATGVMTHYRP